MDGADADVESALTDERVALLLLILHKQTSQTIGQLYIPVLSFVEHPFSSHFHLAFRIRLKLASEQIARPVATDIRPGATHDFHHVKLVAIVVLLFAELGLAAI